jgi:hypothetical protein
MKNFAASRSGSDRRQLRRGLLVLFALIMAGSVSACGVGNVDITVTRGALSYHLGLADCGVHYTGIMGYPPTSIDLNCPLDLQPTEERPSLLLSVPLSTTAPSVNLLDSRYGSPGYVPGQFVVVMYRTGGQSITCDPRQATGSVSYAAIPEYDLSKKQRMAASFSSDAALLYCNNGTSVEPGGPLALGGSFDLPAP